MIYYRDDYHIIEQALECYLAKLQADDSSSNDEINQVKLLIHRTQERIQRFKLYTMNSSVYTFDFKKY